MPGAEPTPQQVADAVGAGMLARDRATARPRDRATIALGMPLLLISPGQTTIAMAVRETTCSTASTSASSRRWPIRAFAVACNSHGALALATSITIDFTAPSRVGDGLIANAIEVELGGRTGACDVVVHDPRAMPARRPPTAC